MTFTNAWNTGNVGISIHMPHTWHDEEPVYMVYHWYISIHMPHTWHDLFLRLPLGKPSISIHMPHTWHDCFPLL